MIQAILAAILLLAGSAVGQEASPPQTKLKPLGAAWSRTLEVPRFRDYGFAQCDNDGDLFFQVPMRPGTLNDTSVLRLSHNRTNLTWYRVSGDLASKTWYTAFSVTLSGRTWFLEEELDGLYVFGFDSDGKLSTQVKVDTPGHLGAEDFLVSDAGQIFIAGYFGEDVSKSLQGKHFQAIFEKSGKLATEMKSEDAKDVDLREVSSKPHEGTVAWGLTETSIFFAWTIVISPMGEVVRRIPFQMLAPV